MRRARACGACTVPLGLPPWPAVAGFFALLQAASAKTIKLGTSHLMFMPGQLLSGDGLGQLEHGHRVHLREVVAGDRVVVLEAQPVLLARAAFQRDRRGRGARLHRCAGLVAALRQIGQRPGRHPLGRVEFLAPGASVAGTATWPPDPAALLHEVVGDGREHIVIAGEQVTTAIAIAVHGVIQVAGRHELAHAHRTGIAALERGDVQLLLAAQLEQLGQFVAEEQLAAHFAFQLGRVATARVIERQRVQRIEHAVVTGIPADDRHDHAGALLHAIQFGAVFGQERAAAIDARLADEHRPVFIPRLDPFGRARHRGDDRLAHLCLVEHAADLLRLQAIALGGIGDEAVPRDLERDRGEIDRRRGGGGGFRRGLGRAMGLAAGWRGVLLAWGEDGGDFGWVAQATRPRVSMQARVRRIIVAG